MRARIIMTFLLTAVFLLLLSSMKAYAYEEPVGGITIPLTAFKAQIASECDTDTEIHIMFYSALYGVDNHLVTALIDGESQGQVLAVNHNDNGTVDRGLMQINSCNYEWLSEELGITDFYEPRQNIQAGCYILGLLSAKYDNVHRILMSYNMGETQTRKLWSQGITSSRYSRGIIEKLEKIKEDKQ